MERKFTSCKEEKKEKNKLTLSHDYHMVIVKKKNVGYQQNFCMLKNPYLR
jgi:hypothetical protein